MTALRTHYEPHLGRWLIDSPVVLNDAQVERIRQHTLMIQRQRHAGMVPGDRREEAGMKTCETCAAFAALSTDS